MTSEPTVSILIDNYNYAAYLGDAIQSAVDQGPDVEVVVVDDGSTDNSAAIAEAFGQRIRWISKTNGGQGSAFNTGLAAVTGAYVMLLDSDDSLTPGALDRVVAALGANPGAAMVVHRLQLVDGSGASMGETLPAKGSALPAGDLRGRVMSSPDDIPWQPTSGITLQVEAARRALPIPEDAFRICADAYLSNTVGLLGLVVAVDEVGAKYRIHGTNAYFRTAFDLDRTSKILKQNDVSHAAIRRLSVSSGQVSSATDLEFRSVTDQVSRLLVRRLTGESGPVNGSIRQHTFAGMRAAAGRRDRPLHTRIVMMGWFAVASVAPRQTLPRLAGMALNR